MIEDIEKKLKIPRKKKVAETIRNTRYLIKKDEMNELEKEESVHRTLRESILSGQTSPFLRAVILMGESNTHYVLSIFHPDEEPLIEQEIAGVLINHEKGTLPIKEESINYELKMEAIRKHLQTELDLFNLTHVTLANVHHDYVRYFGESCSLEEVMIFHILHNSSDRLSKVIRKV